MAHFITHFKQNETYRDSQVVIVGGSYGGTMVAWFRQLYPHLVVGAWSSSAPVLAKVDYVEYKEVVGSGFQTVGGDPCYERLQNAFAQAEEMIENEEFEEFRQLFGLCDDFNGTRSLDVWSAFSTFSDVLAGIVQTNRRGNINAVCESLTESTDPDFNDVQEFARWFHSYVQDFIDPEFCLDNYDASVDFYRETSWDSDAARSSNRQWFYQTCSEYGWYQTSNSEDQPFGSSFPVDLYVQLCNDVYGEKLVFVR